MRSRLRGAFKDSPLTRATAVAVTIMQSHSASPGNPTVRADTAADDVPRAVEHETATPLRRVAALGEHRPRIIIRQELVAVTEEGLVALRPREGPFVRAPVLLPVG